MRSGNRAASAQAVGYGYDTDTEQSDAEASAAVVDGLIATCPPPWVCRPSSPRGLGQRGATNGAHRAPAGPAAPAFGGSRLSLKRPARPTGVLSPQQRWTVTRI